MGKKRYFDGLSVDKHGNIILEMNAAEAACLLSQLNNDTAASLIEAMVKNNVAGTAKIAEEALSLNLENTVSFIQQMNKKSLAQLLVGIARLRSTYRRAAEILEEMTLEKAINAVKIMIELEVYEDIAEILQHVNTDRLNRIFEALTQSEKTQLLPYLTPEIITRISNFFRK